MAKIDELTVDLVVNSCERVSGSSEKVGTMKPLGKENVAKCIKNIGQYILDSNISVNELPEVEVIYTNRLEDTSMINNATAEQ